MDQPDHAARCDAAASALRRLLELPERRPGAWESQHVSALEGELHGRPRRADGRCSVNAERIAYLVTRSLSAEHEVSSATRSVHTVYRDRIALSVVDTDGDRWRLYVLREPWSAPG